jgi:hypothetical protein
MGIAIFSPSLFRAPGLSMVFAPVQALVAFFMPVQSGQASYRQPADVYLPRTPRLQSFPTNRAIAQAIESTPSCHVRRLKVMREFDPGIKRSHAGRMVISGRMADVCAELDRIAQKETLAP